MRAHLASCSACERFARRARAADVKLSRAFRVPPPERLVERLRFHANFRRRRGFFVRPALAAMLLLLVVGLVANEYGKGPALSQAFLAHVMHDPLRTMEPDSSALSQLAAMRGRLAMPFDVSGLGHVTRVRWCEVEGRAGMHFVIEREGVRATVFVLAGNPLWWPRARRADDMSILLRGVGPALLAVLCPDGDMARLVADRVSAALGRRA